MRISLQSSCFWQDVHEILIEHYPFVLGRHPEVDCPLAVAFVSRLHCQFQLEDDHVLVQDLESFNGTFVNGRRIYEPTPIHHGDEVSLGSLSFRVSMLQDAADTVTDLCHSPTGEMPLPVKEAGSDKRNVRFMKSDKTVDRSPEDDQIGTSSF